LPRDLLLDVPESRKNSGAQTADKANTFLLPAAGVVLEDIETSLVEQALARAGGNQTRAAELLGISRDQLRYRIKKLQEPDTN
jgi:DNA-binding NtrC family response regulator